MKFKFVMEIEMDINENITTDTEVEVDVKNGNIQIGEVKVRMLDEHGNDFIADEMEGINLREKIMDSLGWGAK